MSPTRAPRSRNTAVAKAANAGTTSRTVWIIAAVVIVIGVAAVMAVALSQEESSSSARGEQTASVSVSGDPLPLLPQNGPSEAVGREAPEVSGTALTGGSMSIEHDGTPKVVAFFTHWCPACQAEVPVVSEWYNGGNAPDDVDFVAVSTGVDPTRPNYPPRRWFDREDWEVPTLLDSSASEVATAYGLTAYPYWVVIDGDGVVVNQLTGQLGVDQIEGLIEQARGES